MSVAQVDVEGYRVLLYSRRVDFIDVVIVDGVVRKNRYGRVGGKVGDSIVVWDCEEV